jgi:hypothetical protein
MISLILKNHGGGVLAKIQKYNSQNASNGGAFTGLAI